MPLGPGSLDLVAIIAAEAAAAAATKGYAAAASPSAAPAARVLSPLKLLHLRFIYRVITNAEIPRI